MMNKKIIRKEPDLKALLPSLNIAASEMRKFAEEVNRITPLKQLEGIMALTKNKSGEIKSVFYGSRDHKK